MNKLLKSNPISKYIFMAKVSIQDALVYALNFLGRSMFLIIIITLLLFLWKTIYGQGVETEDYNLNRMIWYLIIGELITLSGVRFYEEVSDDVKSGQIAYQMNKPYNYVFYQFANYLGKSSLQLVVNVIIAIPLGLLYVGPLVGFSWQIIPIGLYVIVMGLFLDFMINISLALSAFWVEENRPFRWIYQKTVFTLGGMLLPIDLFPESLYNVSKYLPFAFITYFPAKIITDFDFKEFIFLGGIQLGYFILALILAQFIYSKGVKKLNVNGG